MKYRYYVMNKSTRAIVAEEEFGGVSPGMAAVLWMEEEGWDTDYYKLLCEVNTGE